MLQNGDWFQATLFGGRGGKVVLARNLLRSLFQALFFYFVKCKVVNHLVRGERGECQVFLNCGNSIQVADYK